MAKKLIPLLAIAVILVLAVAIKVNQGREEEDIITQMQMKKLLPGDFTLPEVTKIEVYAGNKANEKVVLTKLQRNWKLASAYQAPADKVIVEKFLVELDKLYGELRSENSEQLDKFAIGQEQALHLKFYKGEKLLTHLLVGKKVEQTRGKGCFVRYVEKPNIYFVSKDLHSQVGIWSDDGSKAPENSHWLEKYLLKIDKSQIAALQLHYPDKKIAFARKKEKGKLSDKWELTSTKISKKFKESEVNNLVTACSEIKIRDVVDPKQKEKWGLADPKFRLQLTMTDGKKIEMLAGRPDLDQDGYVYLNANPNLVYKMPSWQFGYELFRQGSKFFDLPKLVVGKDQVKELELLTPSGRLLFVRLDKKGKDESADWQLREPKVDLQLKKDAVSGIINKLSNLDMEDYTDQTDLAALALAQPQYRLRVKMKDDSEQIINAGNPAQAMKGRYVTFAQNKLIGVIPHYDFTGLFPEFAKLFALKIVNTPLEKFTMARKDDSFTLTRKQEKKGVVKWQLQIGKQTLPASVKVVQNLIRQFQPLTAKDVWLPIDKWQGKKADATVQVQAGDDVYTYQFYPKQQGRYPLSIGENKSVIYWLDGATSETILQESKNYKHPEKKSKKDGKAPKPATPKSKQQPQPPAKKVEQPQPPAKKAEQPQPPAKKAEQPQPPAKKVEQPQPPAKKAETPKKSESK